MRLPVRAPGGGPFLFFGGADMTQNPLAVDKRGDQLTSTPTSGPPLAPSNGGVITDTSTMINESPTFVTQTRAERVVAEAPAGPGLPASTRAMTTRTTMFSGDPAYRGVQAVLVLLGLTELVVALRVVFRALAATDTGIV
jgi:hypothetical protein